MPVFFLNEKLYIKCLLHMIVRCIELLSLLKILNSKRQSKQGISKQGMGKQNGTKPKDEKSNEITTYLYAL